MRFTVVTPCYNSARFLAQCLDSVQAQRGDGLEVEHIVIDGGSRDGSWDLIQSRAGSLAFTVSEKDNGPAHAINKGLRRATGDALCWLNADDLLEPGALARVAAALATHPDAAFAFGRCPIIDESGAEIRRGITRVKEACFPVSCRFLHQILNYVSQPACFFRRAALDRAGLLREDWVAAWDYEYILRYWRLGGGRVVPGGPLAKFRWRPDSISGSRFITQFDEEWRACAADAGRFSPQAILHKFVQWGVTGAYALMKPRAPRA